MEKGTVSPRIRRLQHEAAVLAELNERSSLVEIEPEGTPPTAYRVKLGCESMMIDLKDETGTSLVRSRVHEFRMSLGRRFPSDPPEVEWRTPIFHPNFKKTSVCLGNLWAGTDSLSDLVVTIAHMVQYKEFNVADPLNPTAALWVRKRLDEAADDVSPFPLDPRPVVDLDFDMEVVERVSQAIDGSC